MALQITPFMALPSTSNLSKFPLRVSDWFLEDVVMIASALIPHVVNPSSCIYIILNLCYIQQEQSPLSAKGNLLRVLNSTTSTSMGLPTVCLSTTPISKLYYLYFSSVFRRKKVSVS